MPVILMTGIPSSGKSTRAKQLRTYFENDHEKKVHVVSENDIINASGNDKSDLFKDSTKEKAIRGQVMSESVRWVDTDDVLIIDAGNYIKGYRYELYCATKNNKTTQCTVHCELPAEMAWQWNCKRDEKERYSREIFDALVMRYEAPDSRNRWDSPLFTILPDDIVPVEDIHRILFDKKPPPPNLSVQTPPVMATNFLYELDRITQEIVSVILSAQKLGLEGDVKVPGYDECVSVGGGSRLSNPQLSRLRRQFLTFSKTQPPKDITKIGLLFIQYLNTNLS